MRLLNGQEKKSHLLAFKVLLISLTGTIYHPWCSLFYLSPEHLGRVTSHPSQRPLTQGQVMWFLHPIPTSSFSRAAGWAGEVPAARPCQHCLAWPVMFYGNPRLQGQSILAEILAQMNLGLFYYWLTQAQIVLAGLISHSCIWFGFLFLFIVKIMELYLH